jgi:hypothetical protein
VGPRLRLRVLLRLSATAVPFCGLLLVSLASKETSLVVPFLCIVHDIAVAMTVAAQGIAAPAADACTDVLGARAEAAPAPAAPAGRLRLLADTPDAAAAAASVGAAARAAQGPPQPARVNSPLAPELRSISSPRSGDATGCGSISGSGSKQVRFSEQAVVARGAPQPQRGPQTPATPAPTSPPGQPDSEAPASCAGLTARAGSAARGAAARHAGAAGPRGTEQAPSLQLQQQQRRDEPGRTPLSPLHFAQRYAGHVLGRDMPWAKAASVFAFGFAVYYVRIEVVARGYTLASWANPLHNSLYHTRDRLERLLSIALVQAFALSKLVLPVHLSHEHNAFKHVHGLLDARNALTAVVWVGIAACVALAATLLWRGRQPAAPSAAAGSEVAQPAGRASTDNSASNRMLAATAPAAPSSAGGSAGTGPAAPGAAAGGESALSSAFVLLFGFGWVLVSYFPSSHAVQYVAFVLAERTLYLPSFGAALMIAELLAQLAGVPMPATPPATPLEAASDAAALGEGAPALADAEGCGTGGLADRAPQPPQHAKQPRSRLVLGFRIRLPAPPAPPRSASKAAGSAVSGSANSAVPLSAAPEPSSLALAWRGRPIACTLRQLVAGALTATLLAYYAGKTWRRNWDWGDEERLMTSNIAMYPEGNVMTVYGLGAVALYKGEIDRAQELLVRACNESTMVEPHILLSQLYWKHRAPEWANATDAAIGELEHVAATVTPRKEVLTNLGMLLFRRAAANDTEALKRAEYFVLAAQVAHGYPEGHYALAQLASNAACIRLMSPKERYGDAGAAERLVNDALAVARNSGGTAAAYRNAATFYAVQGYPVHALSIMEEGLAFVEKGLASALAGSEGPAGGKQAVVAYYAETLGSMQRQLASVQTHAALIASWAAASAPVAGKAVEARMAALGLECYMELLWW